MLLIVIFKPGPALCGETIYAKETNSFFYQNGKIKESEGQFENTYILEGHNLIRTHVYDLINNKNISDDTIYTIHKGLSSDPNMNLPGRKHFIRALGQPGTDAIEILIIDFNAGHMDSIRSTANYVVISHFNIMK